MRQETEGATSAVQVVKLGGELLEEPARLAAIADRLALCAGRGPLVVVHGGGREIDQALARRGLEKQAVDGVRVTDAATLDAVVAVLAGTVNTRLVAALVARGVHAVGLTGVDAALGRAEKAAPHRTADGRLVDLGLVGTPSDVAGRSVLRDLVGLDYVPVVASLGVDGTGQVLNVNADTFAAHLAASLGAQRLWIVGATAGVLDRRGQTIPALTPAEARAMITDGSASTGMVVKLTACLTALGAEVDDVRIIDGREADFGEAPGTTISRTEAGTPRSRVG